MKVSKRFFKLMSLSALSIALLLGSASTTPTFAYTQSDEPAAVVVDQTVADSEEAAGEERPRYDLILNADAPSEPHKEDPDDGEEDRDDLVLLFEVRVGALAHGGGDLNHFGVAFVRFHHGFEESHGEDEGGYGASERDDP